MSLIQSVVPNGCGGPNLGPIQVPLYPPVVIEDDRRRRDRDPPGISVNVTPNQTASGTLQLAGTNFSDGAIRTNGNTILIRRGGRYMVDVNVLVAYPVAGVNSAFFSVVPGYGTPIAGGSSLTIGDQVYSGSTIVQIGEGGSISIVAGLVGAVVLGGTVTVQMIPDTDRRREY